MKTELMKDMNGYLANVGVMYVKLHNLHWNVVGTNFKPVHEYLETLYDAFADVLDSVAEMLKIQGEVPLGSLKAYLAVATVKELDDVPCTTQEALAIVATDFKMMKAQAEEIRSKAAAEDNYDVVALMEGDLTQYNKTLWFLNSMAQ